jgi:hypothetical protein
VLGKDARKANLVDGVKLFDVELRDSFDEIIVHGKLAVEVTQLDKTLTAVPGGFATLAHGNSSRCSPVDRTIHRSAGHYENQENY